MSEQKRLSFWITASLFIAVISHAIANSSVNDQSSSHHIGHNNINSAQTRSKAQRQRPQTNTTRIQIDLKGPNVCGTRCCLLWLVNPKTRQCTKRE
ncbi:hypothetical protein E1301_Tti006385 [Triplophysa tibetana]|uniref:Uncharacterized protein n=1 Tax=Triplophysa tibetana TaxID=1572043 RepID=A0A5A9NZN0_9TELE|nr:hypothetical protein E1301_Tti006385 [Triplophysa tibetana]